MNLGIYIQVPFCQTKCTYCNFHTGVVPSGRFAPYIATVQTEIGRHGELYAAAGVELPDALKEATVDTIYIGGGTPSLLHPELLKKLLDSVRSVFRCEPGEVTLEGDPETVEFEKAADWIKAGVNRVSCGVQSFRDAELQATGRMHRRTDIYRAVELLRKAGFRNISFDLIAGLPRQTSLSWKQSLDELVSIFPEHVSVYMLEIDEGSRLGKEVLSGGKRYGADLLPSDDDIADFYEQAREILAKAGYEHYEISNWARPGFLSKHNLKYWRREPYLGFGAGAHSFSGRQRWSNAHDAAEYVKALAGNRLAVDELDTVRAEQALDEEFFLGLRQLAGIDVRRIEAEYGVSLASRLEALTSSGLLEREGNVVRLAAKNLSISNEVFVGLLR